MSATSTAIDVRPMRPDDRAGIVQLLTVTQGWTADARFDRFFQWKHVDNAFGPSAAWVALAGERVVGFRPFLRWEFDHPDGRVRRAVRPVDAATHPEYQRRGIFRRLTTIALDALAAEGVDFVFNTPNAKSRAGELQLGWSDVGRVATAVRPRGIAGLARVVRSRVPAERWSIPSDGGVRASDVLAGDGVDALVTALAPAHGLRTHRGADYLRWRFGFEDLAYRAVVAQDDPARGIAIFRVRRRGEAVEAALCDVIVPAGADDVARTLEREVVRVCGADYVIRLDRRPLTRYGFVRLPRQGPALVWRALAATATRPDLSDWELALGDIELF